MTIKGNFERFQYLKLEANFLKKTKKLKYRFLAEGTKIENTYFHTKLLCQKPMLREI